MFVSIRVKLFVLMILANALMVAALMSLNAASFSRSFSDYIARQESRRLETLIVGLSEQYEQSQNWSWLSWDSPVLINVFRNSFSGRDLRMLERMERNDRPSGNNNGPDYLSRLIITGADRNNVLLGRNRPPPNIIWLPIPSATSSDVIGYLGFEPSARLDSQFDQVFAQQQQRQLIIIGFVGFLLAAALAIPFSAWLVRPVRKMTAAVRSMTNGDLTVSIDSHTNDELGQLANDFNRLAVTLKKNMDDRQQWVSDIAHELRTPVTLLQADVEAAQDGVRQVNDQWLHHMYAHADRLGRLVNDLHQLSQSDAGALSYRFEALDIVDVIDGVVTQFIPTWKEDYLELTWQRPTTEFLVRGDQQRLTQLFANLAQNSSRYTDSSKKKPGQLVISVANEKDRVEVSWSDSSPGVGNADLPKLFDRLYRVDESRSRQSGGSGLGLAIVKNIVEAHEGAVQADHSELGGLKITVTLPTYQEPFS